MSRSCYLIMSTETERVGAMSCSEQPCSRNVWDARNWPKGMMRDAMNDIGELSPLPC